MSLLLAEWYEWYIIASSIGWLLSLHITTHIYNLEKMQNKFLRFLAFKMNLNYAIDSITHLRYFFDIQSLEHILLYPISI